MKLTKAEKTLIALCEAIGAAAYEDNSWVYLCCDRAQSLANAMNLYTKLCIRRDKNKCSCCGGNASKCYPRHVQGKGCA